MKTKDYTFTENEIMALRDTTELAYFTNKGKEELPLSPIILERNKSFEALYRQFKDDYRRI